MAPSALSLPKLSLALVFVGLALLLSWRAKLGLGRDLVRGAIRAAVQLIAIGYFLRFLFAHERPSLVGFVLIVMLSVAGFTAAGRVEHGPSTWVLFPRAIAAVAVGASVALVPVLTLIAPPRPWFGAHAWIPLGGMMLSSAMNVVALVFERIFSLAHTEASAVEAWLSLGATPRQALASVERTALRAAMIPTLNALLTVGLVALPGMMSGQILSGVRPEEAVRYQLVVMYQLVAVGAVSGWAGTLFARRLLFTRKGELRRYERT